MVPFKEFQILHEPEAIATEMLKMSETGDDELYAFHVYPFWIPDWGESVRGGWDENGIMQVTRKYCVSSHLQCPTIYINEIPYGPRMHLGTGSIVWPSSLALAKLLHDQQIQVLKKGTRPRPTH